MKRLPSFVLGTLLSVQVAAGATAASGSIDSSISAAGNSFNPIFSADGRHLAFISHANNLVTNDDLGLSLDVFVRDLMSSNTLLVSVSTNAFGGANADANYPSVSSNGQFIAFASRASNLVSNDTNNASDVFVRDVVNGTTRLVSVDLSGNSLIDLAPSLNIPLSGHPIISQDGRWVVFESRATNLTGFPDANSATDVFARDITTNFTLLLSLDISGDQTANGTATLAAVSANSRFVAFITTATNVEIGATNTGGDLYVRDLDTGERDWASRDVAALLNGPYRCLDAALSANGRYVAFTTTGTSNAVFRHDALGDVTTLISTAPTNTENGIQISADGRFVLFEEFSGGVSGVRLWNEQSGVTNIRGCMPGSESRNPSMTPDARQIAFLACSNIFYWTQGVYILGPVGSETETPLAPDSPFIYPMISADGTNIAFHTISSELVSDDLNGASDIFMHNTSRGTTELITKAASVQPASTSQAHSFLGLNSISADGRFVVMLRYDDPSAYRDTNGWQDVFVSDLINNISAAASINANLYFTNSEGGTGGGNVTFIHNTNAYSAPIISADGSIIYATRRTPVGRTRVYGAWTTNAMSGAGLTLASRGINVSENGDSYGPSASSNGTLLVFTSTSTDLVEGISDGNSAPDVFLRRTTLLTNGLLSGSNELISISMSGVATGNGASSNAFISPDGRWVIFDSRATDLVTNNAGSVPKLLARDLHSNVTHLASVGPNGSSQWGYVPASAAISGNSRYVAFSSGNIYLTVHDLLTRTSIIAENPVAVSPSLSYDGRFVAFVKQTFNSLPDQIYVRDLQASQSDLVSANQAGVRANGASSLPLVSGDGRYVVFQSKASDLVADDTNGASDIFVRDRLLGATMVVSANAQGLPGNGPSSRPVLAADGRTVVFQSFANDLAGGDYNDKRDVFVLKLGGADTDGDGMDDDWEVAYFGNLSRDGSGDFDDDGLSDLQEFRAGTDPTNSNSVFRVLTVTPMGGGTTRVMWTGNPSRSYRVEFKDDLSAADWTALDGTISWNGSTGSATDPSSASTRYYRVVRLP